jgi:hypothetical protein
MAHSLWIGSSFMVVTSLGLMAHHLFGCWHGDFRLKRKYGEVRGSLTGGVLDACSEARAWCVGASGISTRHILLVLWL